MRQKLDLSRTYNFAAIAVLPVQSTRKSSKGQGKFAARNPGQHFQGWCAVTLLASLRPFATVMQQVTNHGMSPLHRTSCPCHHDAQALRRCCSAVRI